MSASPLAALLVLALPLRAASADWPLPAAAPAAEHVSAHQLDLAHQALDRYVDAGQYAGYVALFARDGKVVDWHADGWQDIDAKVPMAKDSIVRIYSMSKIITSVAVLTLMEDGKIKLSDPIELYLPALAKRQVLVGGTADAPQLVPAQRSVIIANLLSHTSGYYYDAEWSAENPVAVELFHRAKVWQANNLPEFIDRVAQLPLLDQPDTRFRYGINMDILGALVEKVSGQRFDRYLAQRIFQPLGMRDTAFWVPREKQNRVARTYATDASGKLVAVPDLEGVVAREDDTGVQSGGGGLFSTAGDYARFAQMLLNGGELDGVRILNRKTVELMTQNHLSHLADPHPFHLPSLGYGFGVRMITDLRRSFMLGSPGMFGWDGAATTIVWMDPKERTVAILLTQRFPYNDHDIFSTFVNTYYSSFTD